MDANTEFGQFLTSRRARIKPADAGLPDYGQRRVPGLRREEVAVLAGVSVPYYARLERGEVGGTSDLVLDALARALRLDDAERSHLFDLARAARPAGLHPRVIRRREPKLQPVVQQILDSMVDAAAFVRNDRLDVLAANRLGRALYTDLYGDGSDEINTARYVFSDPRARDFYVDWETSASSIVAILRTAAGRQLHDPDLTALVTELRETSPAFSERWARHDVGFHADCLKRYHHPIVGPLTMNFESMALANHDGLTMVVYTTDPGTKSHEALRLLGSWTATTEREQTPQRRP